MNRPHFSLIVLALAGVLLAGCKDRSDPVKPTVGAAITAAAPAAGGAANAS